jgi:alcohol dehydrogenase YqhD (iron-dependent ADH family)
MEIRTTHKARKTVDNFSIRLLNLQLDKKRIDDDIKSLSKEFKKLGVPVRFITETLAGLK